MAHPPDSAVLASGVDWFHGWQWAGKFTTLDLIAAATNALNGALLARRPDHYKNFTVVGIILMALLMGLGGGMTRDVLINQVPGALTNPAYITVCLAAGIIGYSLAYNSGQLFREGLFQFMTSFSLPLYAIVGAQKGVDAGLPVLGVLALAVIAPTAGRWYVDVSCGVPPKQFIRGEWFVTIALLTGIIWVICDSAGPPDLGVGADRIRGRIHGPGAGPVLRVGGTPGQRTQGRVPARRRPPDARPQAPGQVRTRDGLPRPDRPRPGHQGREVMTTWVHRSRAARATPGTGARSRTGRSARASTASGARLRQIAANERMSPMSAVGSGLVGSPQSRPGPRAGRFAVVGRPYDLRHAAVSL